MSSTYSPDLRIQLIGTGDQAGAWGNSTNINLGTLIEGAIAGWQAVTITGTPQALTANNGSADQARLAMLQFTGASSAYTVYIPPNSKQYVIYNNTSYTATIGNSTLVNGTTPSGGSTVTIPAQASVLIYSDGTNVLSQFNYVPNNLTVNGTVSGSSFSGSGTGLTGTATSLNIGGTANTATYIAGGGAGYLPYQTSASNTTFLAPGTNGYVLTLASGLPTWAASSGGVASITGTASQITASSSTGAVTLSLASNLNVNSAGLAGGTTGSIPYQSATNTTTFLAPGTSGYILQSNGAGAAPSWVVNSGGGGGVTSITGTANQITASASSGAVTLSIPSNASFNTTGNAGGIANSGTTGWNITPSGTKLYFNYGGTNVGSLDSSGNFIAKGNVTANGTP